MPPVKYQQHALPQPVLFLSTSAAGEPHRSRLISHAARVVMDAMATANGRNTAAVFTRFSEAAHLAKCAEDDLSRRGLPLKFRKGAKLVVRHATPGMFHAATRNEHLAGGALYFTRTSTSWVLDAARLVPEWPGKKEAFDIGLSPAAMNWLQAKAIEGLFCIPE